MPSSGPLLPLLLGASSTTDSLPLPSPPVLISSSSSLPSAGPSSSPSAPESLKGSVAAFLSKTSLSSLANPALKDSPKRLGSLQLFLKLGLFPNPLIQAKRLVLQAMVPGSYDLAAWPESLEHGEENGGGAKNTHSTM